MESGCTVTRVEVSFEKGHLRKSLNLFCETQKNRTRTICQLLGTTCQITNKSFPNAGANLRWFGLPLSWGMQTQIVHLSRICRAHANTSSSSRFCLALRCVNLVPILKSPETSLSRDKSLARSLDPQPWRVPLKPHALLLPTPHSLNSPFSASTVFLSQSCQKC